MSDQPEPSEQVQPETGRSRLLTPEFTIVLIGGVAIALIILMCIAVAVLAYWGSQ